MFVGTNSMPTSLTPMMMIMMMINIIIRMQMTCLVMMTMISICC